MGKRPRPEKDDAPFNMAMMFYLRINKLLESKDKAAIMNDVHMWYNCLKAIFRNIKFKFDDEECSWFKGEFEKVKRKLSTECNLKTVRNQVMSLVFSDSSEILDNIDSQIMIKMDKYKMIFPRIEVRGGLSNLLEGYGIDDKKG